MRNASHGGLASVQRGLESELAVPNRRAVELVPAPAPAAPDLHVYCINLERSPHRRRYMERQAAEHGLVLHFVEAIDGANASLDQMAEYRSAERRARFGFDLEPTEVAAALSHRKTLETIRAAGHSRAVVIEDDVALLPDFKRVVAGLYQRRDLAFDVLRLYGARNRPGRLVSLIDQRYAIERPYRPMCGLQAYMVNGASIDRIVRSFIPIVMQIDVAMDRFWENDLRILRVRPFIVQQVNLFASDIAAPRDPWRAEKKRLIRLGLRTRRALDHVARAAYILRQF